MSKIAKERGTIQPDAALEYDKASKIFTSLVQKMKYGSKQDTDLVDMIRIWALNFNGVR